MDDINTQADDSAETSAGDRDASGGAERAAAGAPDESGAAASAAAFRSYCASACRPCSAAWALAVRRARRGARRLSIPKTAASVVRASMS